MSIQIVPFQNSWVIRGGDNNELMEFKREDGWREEMVEQVMDLVNKIHKDEDEIWKEAYEEGRDSGDSYAHDEGYGEGYDEGYKDAELAKPKKEFV